jgi:hypothetical protein
MSRPNSLRQTAAWAFVNWACKKAGALGSLSQMACKNHQKKLVQGRRRRAKEQETGGLFQRLPKDDTTAQRCSQWLTI